ncbi:MAG: FAD-binding oxidoreductase [Candidatus Methylarchaceae archaeon HK02M1]|nr:FAD-binding oxidoreductase [Candidatus Methylarchaceae archaeon HK02M1]
MYYGKVDENLIKELKSICGSEYVITDKDKMLGYRTDETIEAEKMLRVPFPDVVVKPRSMEEISELLKLSNKKRVPVTPRGGGTGLSGGVIPVYGGIVLSMENMNKIIEIDKENLMVVLEAGATLGDLYKAVGREGFFFPPHPGDEGAQIGGVIATNAGGARTLKYGTMRSFVKGMEVVLPTGEVLNLGGKFLKNNTGYAIMHLLIGSEGTLGVITKATLKLVPCSSAPMILVVPYSNRHDAIKTVLEILRGKVIPLGIEYMEREAMERSEEYLGRKWPTEKGEGCLMVMITGKDEDEIFSRSEYIMGICEANKALDVFMAEQKRDQENVMEIRSKMYEALKGDMMTLFDITVPPGKMGEFMEKVEEVSEKYGVSMPTYGHAGDGNVHVHLMKTDVKTCEKIKDELYEEGSRMGGVISGEHGIGLLRIGDLHLSRDKKEIELMRRIKKVFDPNFILNPGKIFPT